MKRKFLVGLLAMSILFNIGGVSVEAATKTVDISKPDGCKFTSEWEKSAFIYSDNSDDALVGEVCFGYNTTAIDEDYTWTYSDVYLHKARVKNGKGTFTSNASNRARWAKIEVTHKGTSQVYSVLFTSAASTDKFKYIID